VTSDPNLALAKRAKRGDQKARGELVRKNYGTLRIYARKYVMRCTSLELQDLVSEGAMGLLRAVETFDPTRGVKFMSYAHNWIKSYMQRASNRDCSQLGGATSNREYVTSGRWKKDRAELLDQGLLEEQVNVVLGKRYRANAQTVASMRLFTRHAAVSMDKPVGRGLDDDGEETRSMHAVLASPLQSPEQVLQRKTLQVRIRGAIEALVPMLEAKEQAVLRRRLMPEGDHETLGEIGDSFGVTRERIRQVEMSLIKRLKSYLREFTTDSVPKERPSRTRRRATAKSARAA
jgi:RNA polymerase sigma factor (sigma-70 family)